MKVSNKRTYNSEGRQTQALQTKNRILEAGRKLFQSEGFEGVTIERIAQTADVSAPTIYGLFQSKRGILRTLMDEALPSEQRERLVEEARVEKSAFKGLQIAAKIARQMYDGERAQMDLLRGASAIAPEFKELEKEREHRRYERLQVPFKSMVKEKSLRSDLTESQGLDILWAFTGRDMYRMFVVERGWSSDEYESWLGKLLIDTLIKG